MMAKSYKLESWLAEADARAPATWLFLLISEYQQLYGPPPQRILLASGFLALLSAEVREELQSNYDVAVVWYDRIMSQTMPIIVLSNYAGTRRHAI